jgi:ribose-phosphate pyrophosphokinase
MRIYTRAGDLAFSTFTFPDGQPHFKLETYDREFGAATVEMAIKSPADLFLACLVADTLRNHGYSEINLDIRYLLGARMDRPIDWAQPFTLQSVARIINLCGFSRVRILDVHSEVATRLIRNSENLLPHPQLWQVKETLGHVRFVAPDAGAMKRVELLTFPASFTSCHKKRRSSDGALLGFGVNDPSTVVDRDCLIVDDICDGGGTFVGLAQKLREAGAKKVFLFVTHGIFSKGVATLGDGGIDGVFTTNSYWNLDTGYYGSTKLTVIPISMEKL